MKKKLSLLFLFVFNLCIGQTDVIAPKNVIVTLNQISGNADPNSTVKVDIDKNGIADYSITVSIRGYFEQKFNPVLALTTDGKLPNISVWSEDEVGNTSKTAIYVTETSESILDKLKLGTFKLPNKTSINPEIDEEQPLSTTYKYKVTMLNTNFTVPIARFNLTTSDGKTSKDGDILLFNSIGAGIGYSWGQLEKTTDANGETINNEFTSSFGFHLGVLFSAGSSSTENKNIFAPTVSFSFLDFQLGYGYEMGTLEPNQKKGFFTIAYAIPLSKLVKGKYYIFKASKGYNSKNPLPAFNDEASSDKDVKEGENANKDKNDKVDKSDKGSNDKKKMKNIFVD